MSAESERTKKLQLKKPCKKKVKGNHHTYYHLKDVSFIQLELLLEWLREIRAYERKVKKVDAVIFAYNFLVAVLWPQSEVKTLKFTELGGSGRGECRLALPRDAKDSTSVWILDFGWFRLLQMGALDVRRWLVDTKRLITLLMEGTL
ncbi:hypothetical protein DVH24_030732 [Malus domestica]|uniref:Uncharacterized protein n=1 Tax=Malus domestica TaxID=3750 RepID=A0A498HBJ3_MALDO|nr:hypothetical protein DVH24_030732 [Malus domestica]